MVAQREPETLSERGTETPSIFLLLSNSRDQEMVQRLLDKKYHFVKDKEAFETGRFDLLITDELQFRRNIKGYQDLKEQFLPVLLPVLLLAKDKVYAKNNNSLLEQVDDILAIPTSPEVLQARIKLLLKTRYYSKQLAREKQRFQLLAENSTDMISTHYPEGEYIYASPSSKQILGYEPEELIGKNAFEFIMSDDHQAVTEGRDFTLKTQKSCKVEFRKKTKNGDYKWVESILKTLRQPSEEEIPKIQAITRDISERKEYEQKLEKEIAFIEASLNFLPNIFFMVDSRLNYIRWNDNLERNMGYSAEEISTMSPFEFIREEDHNKVAAKIEEVFREGRAEIEVDLITSEGRALRHRISGRKFIEDDERYIIGTCVDISDQHQVMNDLKRSNEEKQVLLKEIHHRVKNNLAVISGMLQLQSMESDSAELSGKLMDSQLRIQSMASIHELLYKSDSFSRVDMGKYLGELLYKIQETNRSDQNITIVKNIETVELNINQAIPCSLIANEIITNAFKHAFAGREAGQIEVIFKQSGKNVQLTIKDDGPGFQDDVDFNAPHTLGIKLINVLKKQLGARLKVTSGQGAAFQLVFKKQELKGSGGNLLE